MADTPGKTRRMTDWPVHGTITGPMVMIGFGSIGRGTLPLIERHFRYDPKRFTVIDPVDADRRLLDERRIRFVQDKVTADNIDTLLRPLRPAGALAAVDESGMTCHSMRAMWR